MRTSSLGLLAALALGQPAIACGARPPSTTSASRSLTSTAPARTSAALASQLSDTTTKLRESTVRYQVEGRAFAGHLLLPPEGAVRGGVVFGPDWYGVYEYPIEEARRLARLGFAVIVVDVYGEGVRPKNDDEAGRLFGQLHDDRRVLRARALAAYAELRGRIASGTKIAAFGFSMGGMTVLELARAGADLVGVAILSGILDNPVPADAARIQAPVLVLHGSRDVISPPSQLWAFAQEMDAARRRYKIELFGGAAHAFTNPKFAAAGEGPLRYSAPDAAAANAATIAFLQDLQW